MRACAPIIVIGLRHGLPAFHCPVRRLARINKKYAATYKVGPLSIDSPFYCTLALRYLISYVPIFAPYGADFEDLGSGGDGEERHWEGGGKVDRGYTSKSTRIRAEF